MIFFSSITQPPPRWEVSHWPRTANIFLIVLQLLFSNNPHRYPVVFTVRITQSTSTPHVLPQMTQSPSLRDPIIVTLTTRIIQQWRILCLYFRHEVPVVMLFFAYGYTNLNEICDMVAHTTFFDASVFRSLLYVTLRLGWIDWTIDPERNTRHPSEHRQRHWPFWQHTCNRGTPVPPQITITDNRRQPMGKPTSLFFPLIPGSWRFIACQCATSFGKPSSKNGLFGPHGWHFAQFSFRSEIKGQSAVWCLGCKQCLHTSKQYQSFRLPPPLFFLLLVCLFVCNQHSRISWATSELDRTVLFLRMGKKKDFLGLKFVAHYWVNWVCSSFVFIWELIHQQQVRNALYRMRNFVIPGGIYNLIVPCAFF